ncbi:uncharacterized protein LOC106011102 [Aplysia californica]|uniref:Uncharacterized protein LOC106011102 n=1 Tax=Aplysia californica TaxID=6500 RepID=A0ABM0ZUX2_APLCA|nr:uncharacterized protein LOC106011102 [Aplysia californica]
MEYQMAQHEMLKLKHKIIPVVLEDVSGIPTMDKNLRAIIESVTYIKFPGEEPISSKLRTRFWKLLELAMPKKKSESTRSSCGSCASDLPLSAASKTCFESLADSLSKESYGAEKVRADNFPSPITGSGVISGSLASSEFVDNALLNGLHFPDPPAKLIEPVLFPIDKGDSLTPSVALACSTSMYLGSDDTEPDDTSCSATSSDDATTASPNNFSWLSSTNTGSSGSKWLPSTSSDNKKAKNEANSSTVLAPFLSSDNHIIEIREVGKNAIKVTPRPKKQDNRLYV